MGTALAGSGRPFVLASGVAGLSADGRPATENDGLVPSAIMRAAPPGVRQATALLALSLRGVGVRSSVLRFAPTVHGDGDSGFIATYVGVAHEKGVSGYVGDGAHRWPAVHRSDAARLARLAVEAAPAGTVLHAVGDEGVPFRDIAEAIGRGLGVPTRSIAPEDSIAHFGPLGLFAGLDFPATADITRELVGWTPTGPTLIQDLDEGHYFRRA
jgi:nucleoside-diphosphate-sugar epimerase